MLNILRVGSLSPQTPNELRLHAGYPMVNRCCPKRSQKKRRTSNPARLNFAARVSILAKDAAGAEGAAGGVVGPDLFRLNRWRARLLPDLFPDLRLPGKFPMRPSPEH